MSARGDPSAEPPQPPSTRGRIHRQSQQTSTTFTHGRGAPGRSMCVGMCFECTSVRTGRRSVSTLQTSVVPRRTSVVPRRTSVVPGQTSVVPGQTSVVPRRTSVVPRRTSVASRRTSVVPRRTSVVPRRTCVRLDAGSGMPGPTGALGRQSVVRRPTRLYTRTSWSRPRTWIR